MVVIDTNVLAALILQGNRTSLAQELYAHDSDWRSEGFILVEFSNVLATYVRVGKLDRSSAKGLLLEAERVLAATIQLPHARALEVATHLAITAYDARFIAAAQSLNAKLISEDSKLQTAVPAHVQSLAQAVASYG